MAKLNRRRLLDAAYMTILLPAFTLNAGPAYAAGSDKKVTFRLRVPAPYYEIVKTTLAYSGSVEPEHDVKGLPFVFIFIGVCLLPSLADEILLLRRRLIQPGLKIDTRGDEIKVDVASDLPHGMILLVDKTGAKLIEPDRLNTSAELIKAISGIGTK